MAIDGIFLNAAGMLLIILGWLVQMISMRKGGNEITLGFAVMQMAGILHIAFGTISANTGVGALNLISAACAACVAGLLIMRKPKKAASAPKRKR